MRNDVTQLLIAYRNGDPEAFGALVAIVYEDLRHIARVQLMREHNRGALNTTALVNEAYVKLADLTRLSLRDRAHFFAIAGVVMRQIIVDYARERTALKRGGGKSAVPLDETVAVADKQATQILSLHEALSRLERAEPTLARVVECRFFAGYSEQETADALGISLRTAQRGWTRARAWLQLALGERRGKWQLP
jgi:RNA polymerase sigma factor (TIGR02999 family)